MGWDSTCALVNVAVAPQNTHGLGTRRQRTGCTEGLVPIICMGDSRPGGLAGAALALPGSPWVAASWRGHGRGRSLTPAARRSTTSPMRAARRSGLRVVASM